MIQPRILSVLLVATLAAHADAQSFYIDCGTATSTPPSPAYAAAAGFPGTWNKVFGYGVFPLVDTNGQPTNVTCHPALQSFDFTTGPTGLGADDAALFETGIQSGYGPTEFHISQLPVGRYQLIVYGSTVGASGLFYFTLYQGGTGDDGPSGVLSFVPFQGTFVDYPIGTKIVQSWGFLELDIDCQANSAIAGLQLVRLADAEPFCFGSLGDCPCGVGEPGRGCPSSFQPAGAMLTGSGAMQIANDTLQLTASDVSNSIVTLFQGTLAANTGRGVPFGDGLRCAGGTTVRLISKQATGGVMQYPEAGEQSISGRGGVPASGGFRTYQIWYRNSADYCTTSTFNLTNGVAVEWLP